MNTIDLDLFLKKPWRCLGRVLEVLDESWRCWTSLGDILGDIGRVLEILTILGDIGRVLEEMKNPCHHFPFHVEKEKHRNSRMMVGGAGYLVVGSSKPSQINVQLKIKTSSNQKNIRLEMLRHWKTR